MKLPQREDYPDMSQGEYPSNITCRVFWEIRRGIHVYRTEETLNGSFYRTHHARCRDEGMAHVMVNLMNKAQKQIQGE